MAIEDDMAATKAEERRARLAQMMDQNGQNETEQQEHLKPGAFPIASITLRQDEERAIRKAGTATRTTNNGGTATAIPAALHNLESKLDDRRGQVSRMMGNGATTTTDKKKKASKSLPHSAHQSLSHHEKDILAKSSGKNQPSDNNIMVNALQGAFNDVAPDLDQLESTVSSKHRIPAPVPAAPPVETEYHEHLQAEIVDDTKEREKITREAQQMLISQAVVATSIEKTDDSKISPCLLLSVAAVALVAIAAIVGGVCGTGNCKSNGIDDAKRIQGVVDLINSMAAEPIEYPIADPDTATPEQDALLFLTENDSLKLSADTDSARIIQRYGLATLWYTTGPWGKATSASAAWFASSDECQWEGISCDAEGTVVAIELDDRQLSGVVPQDIGLLTALTILDLSFNSITGRLEDTLMILAPLEPTLEVLDLEGNQQTGTIPDSITAFASLKGLNVDLNFLEGSLPESLSSMTQLELLSVASNPKIGGTIPTSLSSLSALTHLGLNQCAFTGSIPDIFEQMTDLKYVALGGLSHTADTQTLDALKGLSKLTSLDYVQTGVSETTLPAEVGEWWPDMREFNLIGIGLGGQIPASIAQWTSMTTFTVMRNSFTGSLPAEVFPAWANTIEYVSLPFNNMQGRILDNIGLWSNLKSFDVTQNDFTGTIPTTIGALTDLDRFSLTGNRFSGEIPVEILELPSWSLMHLDMNDFTGVAPFCLEQSLIVSSTVDCSEVSCTCCSVCL